MTVEPVKLTFLSLPPHLKVDMESQWICVSHWRAASRALPPAWPDVSFFLARETGAIGVITYFLLCGYTPFDRDSTMEEMQAIVNADYSYKPEIYWEGVSSDAKDFIDKLLVIDAKARLTAEQALQHPWLASASASGAAADGDKAQQQDLLPGIKTAFNAKKTFRKAVNGIRLISRLKNETASE